MAEGWARYLKSEFLQPFSAGLEAHGLNPNAVKVMQEVGVDISRQKSQHMEDVETIPFDIVVTVCGHADENCLHIPLHTQRHLQRGSGILLGHHQD